MCSNGRKRCISYNLIKAQIMQVLEYEKAISLNPTYTDEIKKERMHQNDRGTQEIIEILFETTGENND